MREELLATLTALADFAYGWGLLETHVPRLQAAVSILSSLPLHEDSTDRAEQSIGSSMESHSLHINTTGKAL